MYNIFKLKNGLRIVTERMENVNSVSVGLMIKAGSRNETKDINGISHFIEHMFFKGTKKRNAKQIAEDIENVGGQLNAYTGKEATCYYVKALHTHLDVSLDVISDMILNSTFLDDEIEREKGVVSEEINMSADLPEDVLSDLQAVSIYGDDTLAYPILGTADNVRSFKRETILKYLGKYYNPSNAVLSICGKFDMNELEKMVENYFGNWQGEQVEYEYSNPQCESNFLKIEKNIEQLHINLGFPGFAYNDNRGYSMLLLNNILGGGASSILFQKLREENGLCYTVYSYPMPYINTGSFNIYTGLSPNCGDKAINMIKNEISKFRKMEIKDDVISINKEKIKASYILGLESTSSRMFNNAKSVLYKGKIILEEEIIKKIDNISKDSLNEAMEYTFKDGILNGAFVGNNIDIDYFKTICQNDIETF